jgi:hypothetical protein
MRCLVRPCKLAPAYSVGCACSCAANPRCHPPRRRGAGLHPRGGGRQPGRGQAHQGGPQPAAGRGPAGRMRRAAGAWPHGPTAGRRRGVRMWRPPRGRAAPPAGCCSRRTPCAFTAAADVTPLRRVTCCCSPRAPSPWCCERWTACASSWAASWGSSRCAALAVPRHPRTRASAGRAVAGPDARHLGGPPA